MGTSLVLILAMLAQAPSPSPPPLRLGMNMPPIAYWESDHKWSDLMNPISAVFPAPNPAIRFDPTGRWPLALATGQNTWNTIPAGVWKYLAPGRYRITAKGSGKLYWGHPDVPHHPWFDVKSPGGDAVSTVAEFDLVTPAYRMIMGIFGTDPNNYLRDVRWFSTADDPAQLYSKQYLDSLRGYDTLRYMQWDGISGSTESEWPAQATLGNAIARRAAAIELCNQVHANYWVCIPHKATDHFTSELAALINAKLDKSLHVYVEFSNEVWNWGIPFGIEAGYVESLGKRQVPPITRDQMLAVLLDRHSKIVKAGCPGHRVISVYAGQWVWPDPGGGIPYAASHGILPDALAAAPYFDVQPLPWPELDAQWRSGQQARALMTVLDHYRQTLPKMDQFGIKWRGLADRYKLPLLCYEMGPSWTIFTPPWNLRLVVSWDDSVPVDRPGLYVGTDASGMLHVRAVDVAGTLIKDVLGGAATANRAADVKALADRVAVLLPPHVLTPADRDDVVNRVQGIWGVLPNVPASRYDLYRYVQGSAEFKPVLIDYFAWLSKYFDMGCYYSHTFDWGKGNEWGIVRREGEDSGKLGGAKAWLLAHPSVRSAGEESDDLGRAASALQADAERLGLNAKAASDARLAASAAVLASDAAKLATWAKAFSAAHPR